MINPTESPDGHERELERRAILGDRQARKELNRRRLRTGRATSLTVEHIVRDAGKRSGHRLVVVRCPVCGRERITRRQSVRKGNFFCSHLPPQRGCNRRNPPPKTTIWDPNEIEKLKADERHGTLSPGLWGDDKYFWIDTPATDQDYIYNKLLYNWMGDEMQLQARVPAEEWLIHYTNKEFNQFNKARNFYDDIKGNQFAGGGSYLMHLDCNQPLDEVPFGLQFAWSTSHMVYDRYYPDTIWRRRMVLFRSPAAVQHQGDGGEVIFRACTEQDVKLLVFDGKVGRDGPEKGGVWRSVDTGEAFTTPLQLIEWADKQAGIEREWPLPIPGRFRSIAEIYEWATRMQKSSWTAMLRKSLKDDLPLLGTMTQEEAIAYFNKRYEGLL